MNIIFEKFKAEVTESIKLPIQRSYSKVNLMIDDNPNTLLIVNYSRACNPNITSEISKSLEKEISQVLENHGIYRFIIDF